MKILKRIYMWVILAVFINVFLLSYVEFGYLSGQTNIESEPFEKTSGEEVKNISINIPENAKNIKVSYDNLYISYTIENKLIIREFDTGKDVNSIPSFEGDLNYYRWMPDRNLIIYGIKTLKYGLAKIKVLNYDVENERSIDNYPIIECPTEISSIEKIQISTVINCIYIKIKTSETRCRIYKIDIMNYMKRIMTTDLETDILGLFNSDILIFTDNEKKVQLLNGVTGVTSLLANKYKYSLIAVDNKNDSIYIGILDDSGNVREILTGTMKEFENHEFKQYPLLSSIKVEDIFVTDIGNIYTYDRIDKITDIKSKEETKIDGRPLYVRDECIITRNINKIEKIKFN